MSTDYDPLRHSVVQAIGGVWCRYDVDDFVEALFMAILQEIERVHWNVYQHRWGPSWHADQVEDPMIPGIAFVRYYDGCACEDEDEHRPDCRHKRPNFQHEDVQFRWYKYPGRGMSTNKDWTSDEWRTWFARCLETVRAFERAGEIEGLGIPGAVGRHERELLQKRLRARYPEAFDEKVSDAETAHWKAMFSAFDRIDDAQTPCWVCSEMGIGSGGGTFEGGTFGMIARTRHEGDDPDGPCVNCGHVNSADERATLEERRRRNSDAERERWAKNRISEEEYELAEERKLYEHLRRKLKSHRTDEAS